jgi:hypothetical protein
MLFRQTQVITTMVCKKVECLGNYDFDKIAYFARMKFIEGYSTIELLKLASSQYEKEEIALVCLLDVDDDKIHELQLTCKYAGECISVTCREKLKRLIEEELASTAA